MKMKKIFAGMAASALAVSMMAASAISTSALDSAYTAGITFQANTTWNYRDLPGEDGDRCVFPQKEIAVQGAAYGISTDTAINDTAIQYDGTYTVSIATSGTIGEATPGKEGTDNGFIIDEANGLTRAGSPWSMLTNYELPDDGLTHTQEELADLWAPAAKGTDKFNLLCISTDIPCEYDEDDMPVINGTPVKVTDVKVDMAGTEYTPDGDVFFKADNKAGTLCIVLINTYGDSTIDPTALPAADGTISATFTIEGLGKDPNAAGGDSSTAGTDSSKADSKTDSKASSTAAGGSTSKASSTASTSKAASTASSTAGTDATETGATAGLALAGIALAGAAIVVAKRK